jgi:acyl carrier protein
VVFQRPLRVFPGMRTWLELVPDGTGGYHVTVTSGTDIYSSGQVGAGPVEPAQPLDVVAARDGFAEDTVPPTVGLVKISFGPRWQGCMRRRWSGPGCEILELELDEQFHADLEAFALHPAALDCAVSLGQTIRGEGTYLPFSYEEVAVHAPLPARFYSVVRHRDDTTADLTTADMWLVDEEGVVVVTVRGFGALRIDNAFANESMMITLPASGSSSAMASSEQGAEALRQMLAARVGPQVAWSPENLAVRIRRSAQVTRAAITAELTAQTGGAAAGAGRSLSTEYVAPAGEVEVALADLWSQTLGVERIGAEDDFFDLGGNSLFAVQLVSRIGQRFSIEASAALLFDSRNIRALAAAIEELLLAKVANLSEEEAVAALRTHAEVAGV